VSTPGFREEVQQAAREIAFENSEAVGPAEDVTIGGQPALRVLTQGRDPSAPYKSGNNFLLIANKRLYIMLCFGRDNFDQVRAPCNTVLNSFKPGP
jgi:hypothetical protein